jgi:predicted alpha/beta superfamily hydrolase
MRSDYPQDTILGSHIRTLYSNIVNDEYKLSIWLPLSYDESKQTYPTLYVLDSPVFFGPAALNVLLREGNVPEMIVVGIGKQISNLDEWWPIRWRDYSSVKVSSEPTSGSAAAFLGFIEQELIPFIEAEYRTQRNERTIWGQSLSGIFALSVMFGKANLFNRYIITAPSFVYERETLLDYDSALAAISFTAEVRLFVSVGSLDETFGPYVEEFMSSLFAIKIPNLKFQTSVLDGFTHTASAVPGFIQGLEAVFSL